MNMNRLALALTVINLILLIAVFVQSRAIATQTVREDPGYQQLPEVNFGCI
ncbi:MAG: hypothetical protein ACXW4U_00725 [Anaerolineales bacterium]